MRRDDIIAKLKDAEPALRRAGVDALYLFGSMARDEARADSDVNVFVDPESDERFGFLQYMDAYQTIRDAIGTDVESGYSTREGLSLCLRRHREGSHPRLLMAPTKSPKLRLLHIRDEIDDLTAALADVSFEAYHITPRDRTGTADHLRGRQNFAL